MNADPRIKDIPADVLTAADTAILEIHRRVDGFAGALAVGSFRRGYQEGAMDAWEAAIKLLEDIHPPEDRVAQYNESLRPIFRVARAQFMNTYLEMINGNRSHKAGQEDNSGSGEASRT